MRNSRRNLHILSAVTFALSLVTITSGLKLAVSNPSKQNTSIETIVGSSEYSVGNSFGTIYSIDGKQISEIVEMNGNEKCVAINGYSEIVGSESGLLINELRPLLLANNKEINRRYRTGDNVITTLHNNGMRVAHSMLADYDSSVEASICVISRDGAVLVSAGNNSYDGLSFFEEQPPKDLFVDYNVSDNRKGSSFKPLVYRMLLGHISELPDNMIFTSGNFTDTAAVLVNGEPIHNWDYCYNNYYESYDDNGNLVRTCTLANLLEFSSNTAPVRLTRELGFEKAYTYMTQLYALDRNIQTDINELSSVSSSKERLPWFFFGQDAAVSPLRMCSSLSFAVSGEFAIPFYVAALQKPDGNIYYMANPSAKEDYSIEINVKDDILNNALEDTFESYLSDKVRSEYSQDLLESRRILCKSGTAENSNGTENRVLMMTLLNKDRTNVIGTACICVNNSSYSIGNDVFIIKLLNVFESIGML